MKDRRTRKRDKRWIDGHRQVGQRRKRGMETGSGEGWEYMEGKREMKDEERNKRKWARRK